MKAASLLLLQRGASSGSLAGRSRTEPGESMPSTMPSDRRQSEPAGDHRPLRSSRILAALCIVLAAFNGRTIFSSNAAVLPSMSADLGLSGSLTSWLTALPILCMGAFAPVSAWVSTRIGAERTLLLAALILCVALAVRSAGSTASMFLGTGLAGASISAINVVLPVLVKAHFPNRASLLTSFYTTGIGAGAASGAALTIPLSHLLSSTWETALLCWLVPALLLFALVGTLVSFAPRQPTSAAASLVPVSVWRNHIAIRMTAFFALHSGLSYSIFGWLAPILVSRGMSPRDAGIVVAETIAAQMAGSLTAPTVAARCRDQRYLNPILAIGSATMLSSFLFCPLSLAFAIGPIQGLFQGSLLAVSMLLVVTRSGDAQIAARVSAQMQSAGMIMAAATPLAVGLIHSLTGSFQTAALLFVIIGAAAATAGYLAGKPGIISTQVR